MAPVPLGGAIAQLSWIKAIDRHFFVRKKPRNWAPGRGPKGWRRREPGKASAWLIVEDLTTTGGSALKASEAVARCPAAMSHWCSPWLDRDEGAWPKPSRSPPCVPPRLYKAGEFLKG